MTLEALLDSDADVMEKMTDSEVEAFFKDSLAITRPDRESAMYAGDTNKPKAAHKKTDPVGQLLMNLTPEKKAKLEEFAKASGKTIQQLLKGK